MQRGPGRLRAMALPLAVALLAPLATLVGPGAPVPPFLPIGDYATYEATTPAAIALAEPVLHAPWIGTPAWPVSMAAAVVVLGTLALASRALGAAPAAAVVVLAALVSRPDLRALLATAAPALLGVACLWGSLIATRVPPPAWRGALWALALTAAALALWPPLVVVAPAAVAWALVSRGDRGVAAIVLGVVVGVAVGLSRWAADATTIAGATVSLADVWHVVATAGDRGTDPFVWPPLSSVRLPMALMVVGAAAMLTQTPRRWTLLGGAIAAFAAAALVPAAWRAEAARALYWSAWPLVAFGLGWFVDLARPRGRPVVLGSLAAVLIGGGISASRRDVEAVGPRAFAAALTTQLVDGSSGTPTAFVAEDTRLDTALVAALGRRLERVRPTPLAAAERAAAGATVLVGSSGRRTLELWGVRFAERLVVEATPVRFPLSAVTGRFRCVPVATPWRELPGLEFTGRLGVHLPAGQGRFEAVVVAMPPVGLAVTSPTGQPRGRLTNIKATLDNLPGVLWPGGMEPPDPASIATRVELDASPAFATSLSVALGTRAPAVAVRFLDDARSTGIATVCAAPLPREDPLDHAADAAIALDDPAFFAGGWHAAEGSGSGAFRWTAQRARMLVPSVASRGVTVSLEARAASDGPVTLTALVNGWPAGTRTMPADGPRYEWAIPPSIWVDGTTEIGFEVSRTTRPSDSGGHDTRELGMIVTGVRLRRQ